jgi:hypothetical protein
VLQDQAACRHQAQLARFHLALKRITGWRLLIQRINPKQKQQQQDLTITGHPAPLTLESLTNSHGWCVGCVKLQQQEQSCWVRFNLPPQLKQDVEIQAQMNQKQLVSCHLQLHICHSR